MRHPWNDENLRELADRIYFARNTSDRCEILDEIIKVIRSETRETCATICDAVQKKNLLPSMGAALCARFIRRIGSDGKPPEIGETT